MFFTPAVATALTLVVSAVTVLGAVRVLPRRTPDRRARLDWQVYLNEPPNPCATGHTRLYLTTASAESSGVICGVCTTELSRPAWMDCPRCHWFPVDGHLHVSHCGPHTPTSECEAA